MITLDTIRKLRGSLEQLQIDTAKIMSSNDESTRQRHFIEANRSAIEMHFIINEAQRRLGDNYANNDTDNELTD